MAASDAREALLRCQDAQDPQQVLTTLLSFLSHRARGVGISPRIVASIIEESVSSKSLSGQIGYRVAKIMSFLKDNRRIWPEDTRAFLYWAMGMTAENGEVRPGWVATVLEAYSDSQADQTLSSLAGRAQIILQGLALKDQTLFQKQVPSLPPMMRSAVAAKVGLCRVFLGTITTERGHQVPEDPEAYRLEINLTRRIAKRLQQVADDQRETRATTSGKPTVAASRLMGF